ncbi:DNA alkylation repair protein [Streptomyces sp. LN499]|uniref:DNA alkylation repair protein n=1 Tax=Streptomyces sp. LN499 TaxID=3112977 RepID=UPI0037108605
MPTADELLGVDTVHALADCWQKADQHSVASAVRECAPRLAGLGLRERSDLLCDALLHAGPTPYAAFAAAVRTALADPAFSGWMIWPVSEAVAAKATTAPQGTCFEDALCLLSDLTPRLTAEFAIRRLLNTDLDRALAVIKKWTAHPDEHVRRLASEGTRPRLPWAVRVPAIQERPETTLPILNALYKDPSEYVRRSVANHLNDISHTQPELAVDVAAAWADKPDTHTPRLIRHALRTAVKKGDQRALALLGFELPVDLTVTGPNVARDLVAVGEQLRFDFTLENRGDKPQRLAVDYIVHYRKANATTSPKVFKLTVRTIQAGERAALSASRSFAPVSTRVLHPGTHFLELQVNGQPHGKVPFEVVPARWGS